MIKKLKPDYFADSVYDIDSEWLLSRDISGLLVDVDNTILPRDAKRPTETLTRWVRRLQGGGIPLLILSNNWSSRVKHITEELQVPLIAPAAKPFGRAYSQGVLRLGVDASKVAIVGDQVFTDILGGNLAGLSTILVPPLSYADLPHTKVLRIAEKFLLRRLSSRVLINGKWHQV